MNEWMDVRGSSASSAATGGRSTKDRSRGRRSSPEKPSAATASAICLDADLAMIGAVATRALCRWRRGFVE